ncbi:hypothetical protein [Sphingomonas glacialis]|uniref:hypothetical protein n=1 Tax=Sphingomonas glacialis TaxID=658225 RepID=UPI001F4FBE31|nr:hypothetical protein [Sphingomonas glacialis]
MRGGRIRMSCSKDGAECGQGWYQQTLPNSPEIRGRIATLAPILHWGVCIVWDWLKVYAPRDEFCGWPTAILADAYGGDDAVEVNGRTGCTGCPLAAEHTALAVIVATKGWTHLSPLLELRPIYRWMRLPAQRLRKAGVERLKSGAIAKNPQRMGPLTLEARATALEQILDIQARVCAGAIAAGTPARGIDLINAEEEALIRELIAVRTFPDKWEGDEPSAAAGLDSVYGDGTAQPILFRDLVGSWPASRHSPGRHPRDRLFLAQALALRLRPPRAAALRPEGRGAARATRRSAGAARRRRQRGRICVRRMLKRSARGRRGDKGTPPEK